MDILCSTDMRICYLAAKARTDFIKVEEKKPTQRNKEKSPVLHLSLLLLLLIAGEFLLSTPSLFCDVHVHEAMQL